MMARMICLWVLLGWCLCSHAQIEVRVKVKDATFHLPLPGATIELRSSDVQSHTDKAGEYKGYLLGVRDTMVISYVGYFEAWIVIDPSNTVHEVFLKRREEGIEEVVINTGYYQLPKERATGSFVHLDSAALNHMVGSNILQRLEGIASGVQFVNPGGTTASDIRIRGLSTIESDETPLIILDNFPYQGDINHIDPNDIASVTILKDAAAASIWGARAGNGVIVLTSKRGRQDNRTVISVNYGSTMTAKPDLMRSLDWLPSAVVMDIEKTRYEASHYTLRAQQVNPYYVELLEALRLGQINHEDFQQEEQLLRSADIRQEAMTHLYRQASSHNMSVNIGGGSGMHSYQVSASYFTAKGQLVGDRSVRQNLSFRNIFRPMPGMNIQLGLDYVEGKSFNNGLGYSDLGQASFGVSPYLRLVDEQGVPLGIPKSYSFGYTSSAAKNGLLDWVYRPLDEVRLNDQRSIGQELRLNTGLDFRLWKGLIMKAQYSYRKSLSTSQTVYDKDSYYVRDLVNSFTQPNGSSPIPHNAIFSNGADWTGESQNGRLQLDFDGDIGEVGELSFLAGVELHQTIGRAYPGARMYNYDPQYKTGMAQFNFNENYSKLPTGRGRIPLAVITSSALHTNRDLSYFTNMGYRYKGKYMLSTSFRWDGSNLFGVKTNQKGVPLWSVGGKWLVDREGFYDTGGLIGNLVFSATYGVSGNVNKSLTHAPVVLLQSSSSPEFYDPATVLSFGNPSLRWEQVTTTNLGTEWSMFNKRVHGALDVYTKLGRDLIGDDYLDPTTGTIDRTSFQPGFYKINYASLKTKGLDLSVRSQNLRGPIEWETILISSWVKNRIVNFSTNDEHLISRYFNRIPPPAIGKSRDVLYAIPWQGLSAENGLPVVSMDGMLSQDYRFYYGNYLDPEKLEILGSSVPTQYGSLVNKWRWIGLEFSAHLVWSGGHVFRRSSMSTFDEFKASYHQDYFSRWEKPGDEHHTHVPAYLPSSMESGANISLSSVYKNASVLVARGDHIRFQQLSLSYNIPQSFLPGTGLRHVNITGSIRNVGVLWKAYKNVSDPGLIQDRPPAPRMMSVSVQCGF